MDPEACHAILGLKSPAPLDQIKSAYRSLAKKFHPDKNTAPGSTESFQKLNEAYRLLLNLSNVHENEDSAVYEANDMANSLGSISITLRENTYSVTIDILETLFLVLYAECLTHHGADPIDHGQNGTQLYFLYSSPGDVEYYGSISLTFYPTTSRLLVQGSSYLLWVTEHLPVLQKRAEETYATDTEKWQSLSEKRAIGRKKAGNTPSVRVTRSTSRNAQQPLPPANAQGQHLPLSPAASQLLPVADTLSKQHPDQQPDGATCQPQLLALPGATYNLWPSADATPAPPQHIEPSSAPPAYTQLQFMAAPNDNSYHSFKPVPSKEHSHTSDSKSRGKNTKKSGVTVPPCPKKDCNVSGRQSGFMTRCMICMDWYHNACIGEDCQYTGVWTCESCRNIPAYLKQLESQIHTLTSLLTPSLSKTSTLESENNRLRQKLSHLEE